MPKTFFIRKPRDLEEVQEGTRWMGYRYGSETTDSYYIAKEVQLGENEFFALHDNLYDDRDWCREFSNQAYPMKGNAVPAIRVSCKGSLTVLIVDPQGFDYPRYVGLELE